MASVFDPRIKIDTPSMNVFDGSFYNRLTCRMGDIIPVLNKEIAPSDHFRVSLATIMRLAPMLNPVYDRLYQDFHAFFVPNRIIDKDWKEFITGGVGLSNSEDTDIAPLKFALYNLIQYSDNTHDGCSLSSLADYLNFHFPLYNAAGYPVVKTGTTLIEISSSPSATSNLFFSALPFLGYVKIWDDWYRNERIQPTLFDAWCTTESSDSRLIAPYGCSQWKCLPRNYAKDLYTTALPEPIIGGPVSYLPSDNVNVMSQQTIGSPTGVSSAGANKPVYVGSDSNGLFVNLSQAAQATVQQLFTAFKMYSFFMKDTYNGNRYVEFIQSHFNRRVPDATLDRAIYLGSFRNPVQFGEIYQTSGTTVEGENVLGDYAGRGAAAGQSFLFDEEFLEHGQIYVMMSIVPEATYFQGIDKKFFKNDRFDYLFPEFQNIGDVSINTAELYSFKSGASGPVYVDSVFGYNTRWYEYKNFMNELHGDFIPKSDDIATMDGSNLSTWTFARFFYNGSSSASMQPPVIGDTFSKVEPINRPFTVVDGYSDNFIIDIKFDIKMCRPLMYYESF